MQRRTHLPARGDMIQALKPHQSYSSQSSRISISRSPCGLATYTQLLQIPLQPAARAACGSFSNLRLSTHLCGTRRAPLASGLLRQYDEYTESARPQNHQFQFQFQFQFQLQFHPRSSKLVPTKRCLTSRGTYFLCMVFPVKLPPVYVRGSRYIKIHQTKLDVDTRGKEMARSWQQTSMIYDIISLP
jgi:hypothetical protein